MNDGSSAWLNTMKYSELELALFFVGCVAWLLAYFGVVAGMRKHKYVEIPALAVVANLGWEITWGFVYAVDVGRLFQYGYRAWLFIDLYINYSLYRYGEKQIASPVVRRHFKPLMILGIIAWTIWHYFFIGEGYDTPVGAFSAYLITVIMSSMYVLGVLTQDPKYYSFKVGVARLVGNSAFGIFNLLVLRDSYTIFTMIVITVFFNVAYLVVHRRRTAEVAAAS